MTSISYPAVILLFKFILFILRFSLLSAKIKSGKILFSFFSVTCSKFFKPVSSKSKAIKDPVLLFIILNKLFSESIVDSDFILFKIYLG